MCCLITPSWHWMYVLSAFRVNSDRNDFRMACDAEPLVEEQEARPGYVTSCLCISKLRARHRLCNTAVLCFTSAECTKQVRRSPPHKKQHKVCDPAQHASYSY